MLYASTPVAAEPPAALTLGDGSPTAFLEPGQAIEAILDIPISAATETALSEAPPRLEAWLVRTGQTDKDAQSATPLKILAWPSPSTPGRFLLHLRGAITALPQQGSIWDLLLRWQTGPASSKSCAELRLPGAIAFGRQESDVVLLLDGSTSMGLNDPRRMRVEAARTFIRMAGASGGIGRVALVQFSDSVRVLVPLTPLSQGAAFEPALQQLAENGMTNIDGSIRVGLELLGADPGRPRASIVLLTDGKQEPGEYTNAHRLAKERGIPVHTVALGSSADRALLQRISTETAGTFSEASRGEDLLRLYGSIVGRILGGHTIQTACGEALRNPLPFPLERSCQSVSLSVQSRSGGELQALDPQGAFLGSGQQAHPVLYLHTPQTGVWQARWSPQRQDPREALTVRAKTSLYPLLFRESKGPQSPVEISLDDPSLGLSLLEAQQPVQAAEVRVTLTGASPQASLTVLLADDGQHGDGEAADGLYASPLPDPAALQALGPSGGALSALIQGRNARGESFRRELLADWRPVPSRPRQLTVSPPIDLGTQFQGTQLSRGLTLLLRGQAGDLQVRSGPPVGLARPGGPDSTVQVKLLDAPQTLQNRRPISLQVAFGFPAELPPGAYSGELLIQVGAAQEGPGRAPPVTARVPWQALVQAPQLVLDPPALELGLLPPGGTVTREFRLATRGGKSFVLPPFLPVLGPPQPSTEGPLPYAALRSPGLPRLELVQPLAGRALCATPEGTTWSLTFHVPEQAAAGPTRVELSIWDPAARQVASLPVSATIAPLALSPRLQLDFGRLEPGDRAATRIEMNPATPVAGPASHGPAILVGSGESPAASIRPVWRPDQNGSGGSLDLLVPPETPPGPLSGLLCLQYGPECFLERWTAQVLRPALRIEPPALALGSHPPGRPFTSGLTLTLTAARESPLQATLEGLPAKPRFPQTVLPKEALAVRPETAALRPGEPSRVALTLAIPGQAEPGEYRARLRIESRLGSAYVPISLRVLSPIPVPPFHVDPASLTLKLDGAGQPLPEKILLTSHSDDDLSLSLKFLPEEPDLATEEPPQAERLCAELPDLPTLDDPPTGTLVPLPGRGRLELRVQARPGATHGERCELLIEGSGERQTVRLGIERTDPAQAAQPSAPEVEAVFQWLGWLFLLALILLVVVVHLLSRRRWIRSVTYVLVGHVALLFMAMPSRQIVGTLVPTSLQISLLQVQEEMGVALSPEQRRRLEQLQASADPASARNVAQNPVGLAASPGPGLGSLLDKAAAPARAQGPSAQAALGRSGLPQDPATPRSPGPARDEIRPVGQEADEALAASVLPPGPRGSPPDRPAVPDGPPLARTAEPVPTASMIGNLPQAPEQGRLAATPAPADRALARTSPRPEHAAPTARPSRPVDLALQADQLSDEPLPAPNLQQDPPVGHQPPPTQDQGDQPRHARGEISLESLPARKALTAIPTEAPGLSASRPGSTARLPQPSAATLTVAQGGDGSSNGEHRPLLPVPSSTRATAPAGSEEDLPLAAAPMAVPAKRQEAQPPLPGHGPALPTLPPALPGGTVLAGSFGEPSLPGEGGQGTELPQATFSARASLSGATAAEGLDGSGGGAGAAGGLWSGHVGSGSKGSTAGHARGAPGGSGSIYGTEDQPLAVQPLPGSPSSGPPASGSGAGAGGTGTGGARPGGGATGSALQGGGRATAASATGDGTCSSGGWALSGLPGGTATGGGPLPAGPVAGVDLQPASGLAAGGGSSSGGTGTAGGGALGGKRFGSAGAAGGDGDQPLAVGSKPHTSPGRTGAGLPSGLPGGQGVVQGGAQGRTGAAGAGETTGGAAGYPTGPGRLPGEGTGQSGPGEGVSGRGLVPGAQPSGLGRFVLAQGPGPFGDLAQSRGQGQRASGGTGVGDREDTLQLPLPARAADSRQGAGQAAHGAKGANGGGGPGGPGGGGQVGAVGTKGEGTAGAGPGGRSVAAGEALAAGRLGLSGGTGTLGVLDGSGSPSSAGGGRGGGGGEPAGLLAQARLAPERIRNEPGTASMGRGQRHEMRPYWGPALSNTLRVRLGLLQHNADWNSSPTALFNLTSTFRERCGLPDLEIKVQNWNGSDPRGSKDFCLILLTANDPVRLTLAQQKTLKAYIKAGGVLWVNDSSADGDERFDQAIRPQLQALFPDSPLRRIQADHPLFRTAYDLSRGYKGFRVPPGDKYRQEFIEGVELPAERADGFPRLGIVYTRNDYSDGMEIDPARLSGRVSLTDLTPAEMLEGSLRMGINLLAYALGAEAPTLPPPPEGVALFERIYRYKGPPLKPFEDFRGPRSVGESSPWEVEEWSTPATLNREEKAGEEGLKIAFEGKANGKVATGRLLTLDLSKAKAVVFDLYSGLPQGLNVSLLFQTAPDWTGYESRPLYVRPGWNRDLRVPLTLGDFKSSKTEWKAFDADFAPRDRVGKLVLILYNLEVAGQAKLANFRAEE